MRPIAGECPVGGWPVKRAAGLPAAPLHVIALFLTRFDSIAAPTGARRAVKVIKKNIKVSLGEFFVQII
jgi:hypothetical protein